MCGISGSVERNGCGGDWIGQQLSLLRHRGPDSQAAYERKDAWVGQTRLAVIDLVTGDPPITNEDETVGVALNGEIYNFVGLRQELRTHHDLKTDGDTEVIAHLAEDHTPVELAQRLDGMFAFAAWDEQRGRLVLGRDRLGKKPLYYWSGGGVFVFGSELKSVLAHPAVPRRLAPRALSAYLTFGYVPTPETFFDGVRSVPPGHVVSLEPGAEPKLEAYWQPRLPNREGDRVDLPFNRLATEVRGRLTAAVGRRLISDVPLGAFLSGGVDSSSVVALMAELSSEAVSTFTIGFDDSEGFDERPQARLVAERFGTDHTEFVVKPDAAELIERLVWHHDQPFGDSSALPTFLLSELTRKHVTVALCGDGGDELFGGYERFAAALARHRLHRLPPGLVRMGERTLRRIPPNGFRGRVGSIQRLLADPSQSVPAAYLRWISYIPRQWRDALLPEASNWAIEDYETIWEGSHGATLLDRLLELNLRTYLLDDLLPKVDRMSMAHGLEVRSPFLDTELVEFALRLPDSARLRGLSLKRVLKAAMADVLPPEILNRKKHGFGVPLDRWFRDELATYVKAMLCSSEARIKEHLVPEAVDGLVREHQQGATNYGHALWTLLTLEVFLRKEGW